MARISFRRLIAEDQFEVVAMRTDQAHSPFDFLGTHLREPLQERGLDQFTVVVLGHPRGIGEFCRKRIVETAPIAQDRRTRFRCDRPVGLDHMRREVVQECDPCGQQLRPVRREMSVPHVEGRQRTRTITRSSAPAQCTTGRLEQRRALSQNLVIVRAHTPEAGETGGQQFVEEPPTVPRVAADEREILGREQHRPEDPDDLPRSPGGRLVDPRPIDLSVVDLDVDS